MTTQLDAVRWCNEVLAEWESLTKELYELRFQGTDESVLRKARINRAEKKKAIADIKAGAASMVQQLMTESERGAVTLEIPEVQLDVRLTWNERLQTGTS